MSPPIRVGIAGLGRSGWNIHARGLREMQDRYSVVAASDPDAQRCSEAAAEGCRAHETYESLIADRDVDLIVIATPNHLHTQHAIAALRAGKHVVCEKPFALNAADADRMIQAAEECNRVVAPFHNRRYEAHLLKVGEVIASGVLGQIIQIRICWHSFSRRWDWQTLKEFGGGALNNNGAHMLDHALQVFGDAEPQIWAQMKRTPLTAGDAEDHLKVILSAPGHPTVDCELTSAVAYPQDRWHIMGSSGGLHGTTEKLEWKWVDWSRMPAHPLDRSAAPGRAYNIENYAWETASWTNPAGAPSVVTLFYDDLYETLHGGKPLVITPQSARRLIQVVDACQRLSPV